MSTIQKKHEKSHRFQEEVEMRRKADRFRFLVIVGIAVILLLVIIAWAITTNYPFTG